MVFLAYQNLLSRAKVVSGNKNPLRRQNQLHLSRVFKRVNRLANVLKGLNLQKAMWLQSWIGIHTVIWNVILPSRCVAISCTNRQCAFVRRQSAIYHQSCQTKSATVKFQNFHRWSKPYQDAPSVEHVIWLDDNKRQWPHTPKANTKPCSHKPAMSTSLKILMKTPLPQPSIPAVQPAIPKAYF